MTCIVGLKHGGKVYLGGDSAAVAGRAINIRVDEKVFVHGPVACGFTSSFRMGQILRYRLTVPRLRADDEPMAWMVGEFIEAARQSLVSNGFAKRENNVDSGGLFLIGLRGRLFRVDDDFQVGETADAFEAIGSGYDLAHGALAALAATGAYIDDPKGRIRIALEAAEKFNAAVRAPFHIVEAPA